VRLGRIIRVLTGYPTVVISGTKLAREIGSSRAGVWRLVEQLRTMGVEIAGHPASGYRLISVPDLLLPELLAPHLRGTIFRRQIHHYYRVGSTSDLALGAAERGAPEGSVFLAEEQTRARGRGSNRWHSTQAAGLYCSVILRPKLSPADVLILSLTSGLAVQAAITQLNPRATPDLKWPNDLLMDGKKVCGILTEMSAEATSVRHIVVGIGINVNHTEFPADLAERAISLRLATGERWSRLELTAALLQSLDREYRNLTTNSNARREILKRFEQGSSSARGKRVSIEGGDGFLGITEGLDNRGFLQVRTGDGLRLVYSGSLRWN
jgi:BirA family biotin operon repressor/biotin-[acetyl-CoA-carboxylase] ligase